MMELENRWLRETYVDELIAAAERDERVVILEADLSKAAGTGRFKERFPERTINVGIAEAGMIGTAAGMAAMGKIPFTHTFTPFSTRRVCDQVTLSVAYAGLGVKIMGSDPGVTAELNGGTHMSMEDVAIMRNIPGMTIFEPTDSAQLRAAFPQIVECAGPVYIRLLRRNAVKIFEEGCACTLGKGIVLREGRDVVAVHRLHMPAERPPLFVERVEAVDLFDVPVKLHLVVVGEGDQVAEPAAARQHGGLPDLPLLALPVADDRIDADGAAVQLSRHRHAHGGREPLPEAARRHIDARRAVHIAVAREVGVRTVEGVQPVEPEIAPERQRRVERRAAVPLGEDEAVAVGLLRVRRVDVHHVEIEHREDLGQREAAPDVAHAELPD